MIRGQHSNVYLSDSAMQKCNQCNERTKIRYRLQEGEVISRYCSIKCLFEAAAMDLMIGGSMCQGEILSLITESYEWEGVKDCEEGEA